ncbi:MAG: hypothetical protein AB4352_11995 [Hormoscilla sp.]
MDFLATIIKILLSISVLINAITVYLKINKLWKRKHEPVVAESISIFSMMLHLLTNIPFVLYYLVIAENKDFRVGLTNIIGILFFSFSLLTGIGFWVKDTGHAGWWQKFMKALKQEAGESTTLIKAMGKPAGRKELIDILYRLAWLDDNLDEKERELVEMFAQEWEIDVSDILQQPPPERGIDKFKAVRNGVVAYLAQKPAKEEAVNLVDAVHALISIDNEVTREEELIATEVSHMLEEYAGEKEASVYGIIVHPQPEQEEMLHSLAPLAKEEYVLGDRAFLVETFHTRTYAEAVSEDYRQQGLFTVVHDYSVG